MAHQKGAHLITTLRLYPENLNYVRIYPENLVCAWSWQAEQGETIQGEGQCEIMRQFWHVGVIEGCLPGL